MAAGNSSSGVENRTRYAAAITKYSRTDFVWNVTHDYEALAWLKEHATVETLTDGDIDIIRNATRESLITMKTGYDNEPEEFLELDFGDSEHMAARYPYVAVMRKVVTEDAIRYFKDLHVYLRARETGDVEIDSMRQQVAASAMTLMQQIEGVVTQPGNANFMRADLYALIDWERVRHETGFRNLFRSSDIYQFEGMMSAGDGQERKSLGVSKNLYSGILPLDILVYLNREGDVTLHSKYDTDATHPFATIHADGTVDAKPEDGRQIKNSSDKALDVILTKIPADDQAKLADRIVLSAGAEKVDGIALTREVLEQNGLLPEWRVSFGNTTVYLPNKLYVEKDKSSSRLLTIIYVEDEKRGLVARSCYKSNSHGVWKLLPAYLPGWYHKGYGEEQLTLLPELQRSIAYLSSSECSFSWNDKRGSTSKFI